MKTLAVYGLTALGGLGLLWLLDVPTWQGLLSAFWLNQPDALLLPWGTRIVWWVIFYAVGISVAMHLDYLSGRLEYPTHLDVWLTAHNTARLRLQRRLNWRLAGIKVAVAQHRAHRPIIVASAASTASTSPVDARQQETSAA